MNFLSKYYPPIFIEYLEDVFLFQKNKFGKYKENELENTIANYRQENEIIKNKNAGLEFMVNAFENSNSWKITKPLRTVGKFVKTGFKFTPPRGKSCSNENFNKYDAHLFSEIRNIYSALQDNVSQNLFLGRLQYMLTY
jgi:hypothetical protein